MSTMPEFTLDNPAAIAAAAAAQSSSAPVAQPDLDEPVRKIVADLSVSSIVGADDVFEGVLRTSKGKSVVIKGQLNGEIHCSGTVVVMKGARVNGVIKTGALRNFGDIGDSKQSARIEVGYLHLGENSQCHADAVYESLGMDMPNRGFFGNLKAKNDAGANG